ncbi:type III-B CRISPR module RAMP protein Cmr4 [Akkermansiaceae bacterium]|nr:type III-B CRISPR module RAMP protein Cmr4 [Akkermansiaceae bacterium]
MKTKLLYLFTRTPLHVGAGASVGAIDQPVQRERHTGFPIIPGSSIKGVLADQANVNDQAGKPVIDDKRNTTQRTERGARLFGLGAGKEEGDNGKAGAISFGQATLLAFPVRSAKGCFAWLTSPMAIKRWQRDSQVKLNLPNLSKSNKAYFSAKTVGETLAGHNTPSILLEDYLFHHEGEFDAATELAKAIPIDGLWNDLAADHLVLVSDDTLSHFAQTSCEVAQHVVIDDETGSAKSGLLFNQENIPAETLFFAPLTETKPDTIAELEIPNPIQLGGDATTGLGYCSTQLV